MKIILMTLLALSFLSCAQKEETATTMSILNFAKSSEIYNSSLIIMGKNHKNGNSFLERIDEDTFSIDLESGEWSFSVIGWNNDNSTDGTRSKLFSGKAYCDSVLNYTVSGSEVELNFRPTLSHCSKDHFGGEKNYSQTYGFKPLKIDSCLNLRHQIENYPNTFNPTVGCAVIDNNSLDFGKTSSSQFLSGKTKSYKIHIKNNSTNKASLASDSLGATECYKRYDLINSINQTASAFDSSLKLPTGNFFNTISFAISSYENDDCSKTASSTLSFNSGLGSNLSTNFQAILSQTSDDNQTDYNALFLNEVACSQGNINAALSQTITKTGYSTTDATSLNLICSSSQFTNEFGSNVNLNKFNNHYTLGANIDFATLSSSEPSSASGTIKGHFYGAGYVLSNMSGPLFRAISSQSAERSIEIKDIIFDNAINNFTYNSSNNKYHGLLSNEIFISNDSSQSISITNLQFRGSTLSSANLTSVNNSNNAIGYIAGRVVSSNSGGSANGGSLSISNVNVDSDSTLEVEFSISSSTDRHIGLFIGRNENNVTISTTNSQFDGASTVTEIGPTSSVVLTNSIPFIN